MPTHRRTPPRTRNPERERAERFAEHVYEAALKRGYRVDEPRGGAIVALANDTGMAQSSVSRMLSGLAIPDPKWFEPLARTLRIPLAELLIAAEIATPEALRDATTQPPPVDRPLSPRDAAADLGITDPEAIRTFEFMVRAILKNQETHDDPRTGKDRTA